MAKHRAPQKFAYFFEETKFSLSLILKERRLHWYGHVEHSKGAVKTALDIQIVGKRGPGRPKMTWKQLKRGIAESGSS